VRVAFQTDQLWFTTPGGIGTYVRALAPALVAEEPAIDLTAFHCRFDASDPDDAPITGTAALEIPGPIRTLYPRWALFGRPKLPPAFDRIELVHGTNPAGVPPVRAGQRLVVTVHDLAVERFPDRFPARWRFLYRAGLHAAARRADALLTPSAATATDLLHYTSVEAARVHVTPLAAALPPAPADPGDALTRLGVAPPYVLFVGTLEPRKNVVRLVRAYRQLAHDLPHALVLAGPDGWHTDELERELRRQGPGAIVRTGRVSDDDLDALYRGAAAFAYPSSYEGFGLPVLEAMARGVPVVTSDAPALSEVAGDAALHVDADDVAGLADALGRLLSDAKLADELRARGLARAGAFSWRATARATLGAYRSVLGGAPR
jgi:glycosyltransferase involved in cell wall biosynthesis